MIVRMDWRKMPFLLAIGSASLLFFVFSLPFLISGSGVYLTWLVPLSFQFLWCASEGWLVVKQRNGMEFDPRGCTPGRVHCRITSLLTGLIVMVSAVELWLKLPEINSPGSFVDGCYPLLPGLSIGFAGLALRLLAIHTLGARFRDDIALGRNHSIERGGIYSLLRHPGEVGFLLALLGQVMAFQSFWGASLLFVLLLPVSLNRMHLENRLLTAAAAKSPESELPLDEEGLSPLSSLR
jgi:protein-S-isoprenylcysteine O-methyltransferase Ste14